MLYNNLILDFLMTKIIDIRSNFMIKKINTFFKMIFKSLAKIKKWGR